MREDDNKLEEGFAKSSELMAAFYHNEKNAPFSYS